MVLNNNQLTLRPNRPFLQSVQRVNTQESHPLAGLIVKLLDGSGTFEGTSAELLEGLQTLNSSLNIIDAKLVPTSGGSLSGFLTASKANLESRGVTIERRRSGAKRMLILGKTEPPPSAPPIEDAPPKEEDPAPSATREELPKSKVEGFSLHELVNYMTEGGQPPGCSTFRQILESTEDVAVLLKRHGRAGRHRRRGISQGILDGGLGLRAESGQREKADPRGDRRVLPGAREAPKATELRHTRTQSCISILYGHWEREVLCLSSRVARPSDRVFRELQERKYLPNQCDLRIYKGLTVNSATSGIDSSVSSALVYYCK